MSVLSSCLRLPALCRRTDLILRAAVLSFMLNMQTCELSVHVVICKSDAHCSGSADSQTQCHLTGAAPNTDRYCAKTEKYAPNAG